MRARVRRRIRWRPRCGCWRPRTDGKLVIDSAARPSQDAPRKNPGRKPAMPDTPTFGRYAEIPYDQMTPEQQEGYRFMIESRGRLPGPTKIWVHNPKLAKA